MSSRHGSTEKVSVSLRSDELASLRKRAKRLYGGNLSAVIAEFAADAALLEAMDKLIGCLGGPVLTDRDRASLASSWTVPASPSKPERKRKAKRGS